MTMPQCRAPNDLLLELDRMEFHVYEIKQTILARQRPVVVITSNNEKDLLAGSDRLRVHRRGQDQIGHLSVTIF